MTVRLDGGAPQFEMNVEAVMVAMLIWIVLVNVSETLIQVHGI